MALDRPVKQSGSGPENRDPITKQPGAHPVSTGVGGAAGGAAAGAGIGSLATQEEAYWREQHQQQPFAGGRPYSDYQSGYRAGYEGYSQCDGKRSFEESEAEMRSEYEKNRGKSGLEWDHARHAARAAWDKLAGNHERLIGYRVEDLGDRKIGTVHNLWTDESGQAAFLGVKTGWLGLGKNHVVPVHTAHVNDRDKVIRLPFPEEKIKNAPAFDADADLTPENQDEINRYYGLHFGEGGSQQPAREQRQRVTKGTPAEGTTIKLKEERVKVGKREVESGGIRLRKIVRTETVQQPVELQHEEIVIERVEGTGEAPGNDKFEEQTVFIPLRREEPVVQKETRVREEVRVGKRKESERRTVSESVRKEDVQVENEQTPRFGAEESGRGTERYTPKERGRDR